VFSIKDSIVNLIDGIKSIQSNGITKSHFIRLSILKDYMERYNVV